MDHYLAGLSEIALNPPIGLPMAGYIGRNHGSTGILDDLHARALYLADENESFLLIVCELLGLDADFCDMVSARIQEQTSIHPDRISIICTHTHSGPTTMTRGDDIPEVDAWLEILGEKLLTCAMRACESAQPACLTVFRGKTGIQQNRVLLADWGGKFTDNWEVRNWDQYPQDVLEAFDRNLENMRSLADEMCDRSVHVLRISSTEDPDRPLALLVNSACHPVTLEYNNDCYSADFPAYMAASLREEYPSAMVMFLNGCCGDINPIARGGCEAAEKIGAALAHDVICAIKSGGTPVCGRIEVKKRRLSFEYNAPYDKDELLRRLSIYRSGLKKMADNPSGMDFRIYAVYEKWAKRMLDAMESSRFTPQAGADICIFSIGETNMVMLPFEVFNGIGTDIRQNIGSSTLICAYANGDFGYFISEPLYPVAKYECFESYKFMMLPGAIQKNGQRELLSLICEMKNPAIV